MARARHPYADLRPPRRPRLEPGAATLAAATLAASAVLVLPIVLWKRYGDGDPLRTAAVTIAALSLCWAVVRVLTRRYVARRLPARTRTDAVPVQPPCRSQDVHRSATQRDRRDPSARPCGPSRCLPRHTARGPRDLGCRAAAGQRRRARRRTRP